MEKKKVEKSVPPNLNTESRSFAVNDPRRASAIEVIRTLSESVNDMKAQLVSMAKVRDSKDNRISDSLKEFSEENKELLEHYSEVVTITGENLKKELDQLKTQVENLGYLVDDEEGKLSVISKNIEGLSATMANFGRSSINHVEKMTTLSTTITKSVEEIKKIVSDNELQVGRVNLGERNQSARSQSTTPAPGQEKVIVAKLDSIQRTLSDMDVIASFDKLFTKMNEMNSQMRTRTDEIASRTITEILKVEQLVTSKIPRNNAASENEEKLKKELEEQKEKEIAMRTEIEKLKKAAVKPTIQVDKRTEDKLRTEIDELKELLEEKDAKLAKLDEIKTDNAKLNAHIKKLAKDNEKLKEESSKINGDVRMLEKLRKENEDLNKKIEDQEETIIELESNIQALTKTNGDLNKRIAEQVGKYELEIKKIDNLSKKEKEHQQTIAELSEKNAAIAKRLEETYKERDEKINELEEKIKSLTASQVQVEVKEAPVEEEQSEPAEKPVKAKGNKKKVTKKKAAAETF